MNKLEYTSFDTRSYDNKISDLFMCSDMLNLEALFLGPTEISDLTPISNLPKLERILLFKTKITDLSPLIFTEIISPFFNPKFFASLSAQCK